MLPPCREFSSGREQIDSHRGEGAPVSLSSECHRTNPSLYVQSASSPGGAVELTVRPAPHLMPAIYPLAVDNANPNRVTKTQGRGAPVLLQFWLCHIRSLKQQHEKLGFSRPIRSRNHVDCT